MEGLFKIISTKPTPSSFKPTQSGRLNSTNKKNFCFTKYLVTQIGYSLNLPDCEVGGSRRGGTCVLSYVCPSVHPVCSECNSGHTGCTPILTHLSYGLLIMQYTKVNYTYFLKYTPQSSIYRVKKALGRNRTVHTAVK